MEELARRIFYNDIAVCFPVQRRFRDCRRLPVVGNVFWEKNEEEFIRGADPVWLERMGPEFKRALIEHNDAREPDEMNRVIYDIIFKDADSKVIKGWMQGPLTETEVSNVLQFDAWVPAKRFGIEPTSKIGQIDAFSKYFTNSCATIAENIEPDGLDQIAAIAKAWADFWLQAKKTGGQISVRWLNVEIETFQCIQFLLENDWENCFKA